MRFESVELVTEWEGKVRRVAKEGENSSYRHKGNVFGQPNAEDSVFNLAFSLYI